MRLAINRAFSLREWERTRKPPRRLRYHPVQARIAIEDKRFVAIAAGRRSGKTELSLERIVRDALQPTAHGEPGRFGIGAPTRPQVREIYWERLLRRIPPWFLREKPNETLLKITLLNGNIIQLFGMEAPQRIEGRPWDRWLLDEYADMHRDVLPNHVRPAVADRNGSIWLIGVPEGRNHFYDTCMRYLSESDEHGFYTWSSRTVLPLYLGKKRAEQEIASLQADLEPMIFAQEIDAQFITIGGRIYYAFDAGKDVHDFPLIPGIGTEAVPWYGGMDFNVSPMCAVWGWEQEIDGRAHVFVWDEIKLENADTRRAARVIKSKCAAYRGGSDMGIHIMHPDPSGKARKTSAPAGTTDFTILAEEDFKVRALSSSPLRRDRYNMVNSMFHSGDDRRRVHIHPRCKNFIKCLDGLLYAEGTNEPDKQKCPNMDHPTDAFGYWISKRHRIMVRAQGFSV